MELNTKSSHPPPPSPYPLKRNYLHPLQKDTQRNDKLFILTTLPDGLPDAGVVRRRNAIGLFGDTRENGGNKTEEE